MLPNVPLRKMVIELRYKPELGFYGKMDAVGIILADQFPDWERSPLTVDVRNKKKHRRLFLSHHRCFYESDLASTELSSEFQFAEKTLKEVCNNLDIKEFVRIGVRQWFAADLNKSFALMVDEIAAKFLNQGIELAAILADKQHDVAYAVDYETDEGWKYHFRLGPMTKTQWFQTVSYEAGIFERPEGDDSETFEKHRKEFPENFLYLDVDCYQEETPKDKLEKLMTTFRRRSHELVQQVIRYCQE